MELMYVIVGIDPGINVGYAAIDLDGRLISAGVEKEANDEKIVGIISQLGIPSIVASDVAPASSFVNKIAARFNVKVHSPVRSMTMAEKREIAAEVMDPHIRDAYAAAIKAYNKFSNRFRQIDMLETEDKIRLKHLAIQGEPVTKMMRGEQPKLKRKNIGRNKKRRK